MVAISAPHTRGLVISLLLAGLAIPLGSTAASAVDYTSTGSGTFSDSSPAPGESITVRGVTTPRTLVTVTVSSTGSSSVRGRAALASSRTLGTTTSDDAGAYALTFTVPSDLGAGSFNLIVAANGRTLSSTSFALTGVGGATGAQTPTGSGGTGSLPVTGASTTASLGVAAALMAAGGAGVAIARRRQSSATQ